MIDFRIFMTFWRWTMGFIVIIRHKKPMLKHMCYKSTKLYLNCRCTSERNTKESRSLLYAAQKRNALRKCIVVKAFDKIAVLGENPNFLLITITGYVVI